MLFMRKNLIFPVLAVLLVLCSGCVSIEYSGSVEPALAPDAPPVVVFYDAAKITRPYEVLGVATASANYREAGNDKIINALKEKARECGANAVLITSIRVEVSKMGSQTSSAFMTSWDYDEVESNWQLIYRDVDQGFVNNMRDGGSFTTDGSANNFTRVIRAEFLRY